MQISTKLNIDEATALKKTLIATIEKDLNRLGIMHRIFGRVKSEGSLNVKLATGKYTTNGKKIQDVIGIRVTLYFSDDIELIENILKARFNCIEESTSKDEPHTNQFEATKNNYVFTIPDCASLDSNGYCDNTFEIQLRTILSEGWHEVEHDFRYKNKGHWKSHKNFDRQLNGLVATLETADWGMLQLFNELSFKNYKDKSWDAMIRHKFRNRLHGDSLHANIEDIFNQDSILAKKFYRVSRDEILLKIHQSNLNVPMNINNLVFIINTFKVQNTAIENILIQYSKNLYNKINDAKQLIL